MSLPSQLNRFDTFVHYQVKVANTTEHLFAVTMHASLPNKAPNNAELGNSVVDNAVENNSLTVRLPAWIPGSYMIRDFAKNLHQLKSPTPDILIRRVDKQSQRRDL